MRSLDNSPIPLVALGFEVFSPEVIQCVRSKIVAVRIFYVKDDARYCDVDFIDLFQALFADFCGAACRGADKKLCAFGAQFVVVRELE